MYIVTEVKINLCEHAIGIDTITIDNLFFKTKEEAQAKVRSLFNNFVEELNENYGEEMNEDYVIYPTKSKNGFSFDNDSTFYKVNYEEIVLQS